MRTCLYGSSEHREQKRKAQRGSDKVARSQLFLLLSTTNATRRRRGRTRHPASPRQRWGAPRPASAHLQAGDAAHPDRLLDARTPQPTQRTSDHAGRISDVNRAKGGAAARCQGGDTPGEACWQQGRRSRNPTQEPGPLPRVWPQQAQSAAWGSRTAPGRRRRRERVGRGENTAPLGRRPRGGWRAFRDAAS